MFLGLPLDTWVLIVLATVPGLALVGWAYAVHRESDQRARTNPEAGTVDG